MGSAARAVAGARPIARSRAAAVAAREDIDRTRSKDRAHPLLRGSLVPTTNPPHAAQPQNSRENVGCDSVREPRQRPMRRSMDDWRTSLLCAVAVVAAAGAAQTGCVGQLGTPEGEERSAAGG